MRNIYLVLFFAVLFSSTKAAIKTSAGSGTWNIASSWLPSGVPLSTDDVNILNGHTITLNSSAASCKSLSISNGAGFIVNTGKVLTISGTTGIVVNGTCSVNGAIQLVTPGATFQLGSFSTFTWNPDANTPAGATLWTNGNENFAPSSSLIIKKWYDMTVPIGAVVTGNFGNLTIDYSSGTTWHQHNNFQTHMILGTLTINKGYIVLAKSNAISNTTISNIILNGSHAYLDFYNGTHSTGFTLNTTNVTVNSGELNFYAGNGTGNCVVNVAGNLTIGNSGIIKCNSLHDGSSILNVAGNFTNNGGSYYGAYSGNGNNTLNIRGNLYNTYQLWPADFYCVVNGNGNATVSITGDLVNNCYMDLIWNTGVSGVGNGNGSITVGGTYIQSSGDFRGIYNLSTYNAGNIIMNFRNVSFTGGILMAYYACNNTAVINTVTINGNLNIDFGAASDVFRLNGLATLGSTNSNSQLKLIINGNLSISGSGSAEFSPGASYGIENIYVGGNTSINGGTNYFQRITHPSTFCNTGNLAVNGGTTFLAYSTAEAVISVGGKFTQSNNSNVIIKGDTGSATFNVNGDFTLNSGNFYQHKNSGNVNEVAVATNVHGDFRLTSGNFWFDDKSNSSSNNILNIYGSSFLLSGNSTIKCAGNHSSTSPGIINFVHNGVIKYYRTEGSHDFANIKQTIKNGATLDLGSDMTISASPVSGFNNLFVESGGILRINSFHLVPNDNASYSGITIKDGGRVQLKNAAGLWDNTERSALSQKINYYLEPKSVIEYNGNADQKISGAGDSSSLTINQCYGILVINTAGVAGRTYLDNHTFIRTQLQLENGPLDLNNHLLTMESGTPEAIVRKNGYVKCESYDVTNEAAIKWMNISEGIHVFPFGCNGNEYIPVTITPVAGTGNTITASTHATSSANNIPFATYAPGVSAIGLSATTAINRWWNITATGVTADIVLSYRGCENTAKADVNAANFSIQSWTGSTWGPPFGNAKGVITGIGTIAVSNISDFGTWVLVSSGKVLPAEAIRFNVQLKEEVVDIKWATTHNKNYSYYIIERSADGNNFEMLKKIDGTGNNKNTFYFHTTDVHPLPEKSYYRLKQTELNGTYSYSAVQIIEREEKTSPQNSSISIKSIVPNPFSHRFSITYNMNTPGEVKAMIFSMNGQVIHDEKVKAEAGLNYYAYKDEKNIPVGNYIITLVYGDKKVSKKILKSNI